jgi:biotin carboxyl carrier protein
MPARAQRSTSERSESEWAVRTQRDHEAIAHLADDLLPALIAKLAVSGLGEIEVRQGGWKARLRMPARTEDTRAAVKAVDAHAGHGHGSGSHGSSYGRPDERDRRAIAEPEAAEVTKIVAKSPAVGIYQPRKDLAVGMKVRSGDRIGSVNVLGVNQDVVAPVDGVIGSSLAESGEAVEYGQELIRIELPERPAPTDAAAAAGEVVAVAVAGKA